MSAGQLQRHRSVSRSSSKRSDKIRNAALQPPAPSITPQNDEASFEPCAATASFLLYAQRNIILCLHHDTLAIERRFDRHREDVSWISADNVSERGAGRLVVSYDTGSTAIVWDLFTGEEVARFAAYEQIRVAAWMKNGNVAFGNSQGNVILFEPSTSEHISARTIFDPITALAPAADCRTFAIGYLNGSILIVNLQPSFTILHTLTTPRTPSPIAGLAWHGSSSKQKSEMLATQTCDGDLRVWSIPKAPHSESPCVIRVLGRSESTNPGPCWFAWSKSGRIVQFSDGQTWSWDVRTKRVTCEPVPTMDGTVGITNYGPTATLFTLGRNHTVQQYDINPTGVPALVANVHHAPANAPPSPPNSIEEPKKQHDELATSATSETAPVVPVYLDSGASSEGEGMATMSPLQKIAQEMDQLEEESRDRLAPLSPVSSRTSSVASSKSSTGSRGKYRYDRSASRMSNGSGSEGTIFSYGSSLRSGAESYSIRTRSSLASSRMRSSSLRKEVLRSPEESRKTQMMDLFPFTAARLGDVVFKSPSYGPHRTTDDLRQQMLSVVFGWDNDIEELIRDELARHPPGSAAGVLLSKWLGDLGADVMASMIGSESMTSSDWMLLALSSMGQDSQKKVGQAFVQRLLEKGDIHPAVAILLGLGEQNDAIEVYVSRKYYMEAVLLTCLLFPNDWQRQSYLVRKWGEQAVGHGEPQLAVRCFSCTSLESSEPWFSPRAQDAVYAQQQAVLGPLNSPPLSPPSARSDRLTVKNSALKLVTNFGETSNSLVVPGDAEQTPMNVGITPIAESALSPGGAAPWQRAGGRLAGHRDPSSARTATPGAYRRRRYPSKSDTERSARFDATPVAGNSRQTSRTRDPQTAINTVVAEAVFDETPAQHRRSSSNTATSEPVLLSAVAYDPNKGDKPSDALPSPAPGVFTAFQQQSRSRNGSRDRKPDGLHLNVEPNVVVGSTSSLPSSVSGYSTNQTDELSPVATGNSIKSAKIRSIDQYISSLEEANYHSRRTNRAESRTRGEGRSGSREPRNRSRPGRDSSETRGRPGVKYIRPAKRSPSSPVPMSPEDAGLYSNASNTEDAYDDERYYKVASPTASGSDVPRSRSKARTGSSKVRSVSKKARRPESPEASFPRSRNASRAPSRTASRTASRPGSPEAKRNGRGLSKGRNEGSLLRSPSSPQPMTTFPLPADEDTSDSNTESVPRAGKRSTSRKAGSRATSARREVSPDRLNRHTSRERSRSRRPGTREASRNRFGPREPSPERPSSRLSTKAEPREGRPMTRKELAARELEERRLSLARRPSAPVIPHPVDLSGTRPAFPGRSVTDSIGFSSQVNDYSDPIRRSHTADPDSMARYGPKYSTGTSTSSTPIGLPATPRAMRHPRYMSADPNEREDVPEVPSIPDHMTQLTSQALQAKDDDDLGPLLPSTVYGQTGPQAPLPRAASAPPEKNSFFQSHSRNSSISGRGGAYKRVSPPNITASIDAALRENQVVVVPEQEAPPLLRELQHLAGPPPPPPPPSMFQQQPNNTTGSLEVINIAIDGNDSQSTLPVLEIPPTLPVQQHAASESPRSHRRGRGSVSEISSRLRGIGDRMRSNSRSRNKSPPVETFTPSPYESVPPINFPRRGSLSQRTRSPIDESTTNQYESIPPPPPPPPPPPHVMANGQLMEQVIPPDINSLSNQRRPQPGQQQRQLNPTTFGYRHPKEIRANMPPEQLQLGVMPMESGGMI